MLGRPSRVQLPMNARRTRAAQGFTLTELLLASAMTGMVIIGANTIFGTAIRVQIDLQRNRSGALSQEMAAGLAVVRIAKHLEVADRINRVSATSLQVRMPPASAADLDDPAAYRWDQYRWDPAPQKALLLFQDIAGGCPAPVVLAREIASVSFDYRNRGPLAPPSGTEPFAPGAEDNNVIEYTVVWDDGARGHQYQGEITARGIPYSDVAANGGDSGLGLLPPALSGPPPLGC